MQMAFASTFSFYLKAHKFHWNVEGDDFPQYHSLFGKIYEEVYGCVDGFAERIRTLGVYMPGSYTEFSMLSKIADATNGNPTYMEMVKQLAVDNASMETILKFAYDKAEAAGKHGLSNFLAERMDAHAKHGWMLKACLVEEPEEDMED